MIDGSDDAYVPHHSLLLSDYAAIARSKPGFSLDATALRVRSREILEVLAHLASDGRHSLRQVERCLAEAMHAPGRGGLAGLEPLDHDWFARLIRVLALQSTSRLQLESARSAYQYLDVTDGIHRLHDIHWRVYVGLLLELGHDHLVPQLIERVPVTPAHLASIEADLTNPHRVRHSGEARDQRAWVEKLQLLMNPSGPPTLDVDPDAHVPFDGLRPLELPAAGEDGPLVTVIVTAYEPDGGLLTAVRSLTAQTWQNLEILIIDDASSDAAREVLRSAAHLDERVHLVINEVNGGTYRARNTGLSLARGEFITFQDADDWSDPDRIRLQLEPLLEDPALVGSRSRCIRVSEELVSNQVGYSTLRDNASSLMIRRDVVLPIVGFFDEVRKAADSEYHHRLLASFGRKRFRDVGLRPLAVIRRAAGSLSRAEFAPGWHHRARFAYRTAYDEWHQEIRDGADPYLPREPVQRPFPAPRHFLDQAFGDPRRYDVVLLGDWRPLGGPQYSMLEEARALSRAGYRVGVAHMEALRVMRERDDPLCEPVRRIIAEGEVDLVLLDESAHIELLIIRYPPILQFAQDNPSGWSVKSVWIVANQAPCERDGSDLRYLVDDCSVACTRLFGVRPLWVPQGPTVRDALRNVGLVDDDLATFDSPSVLDPNEWWCVAEGKTTGRPRVGRYSRDHPMKFPGTADHLLQAYDHPDFDIVMMGATTSVMRLLGGRKVPPNWRLLPQNAVDVREFLADLDYFVYFDHPNAIEAFGRSLLEAAASGCVVVAPFHFKPVFGDILVYAEPFDAADVVRKFEADPAAYACQVDRARRLIRERFSHEAFVSLVATKLGRQHSAFDEDRCGARRVETRASASSMPFSREEPAEMAHGFVVTNSLDGLATRSAWRHERVEGWTYGLHPTSWFHAARIHGHHRLIDAGAVVLLGQPVDLATLSIDPQKIAERIAQACDRWGTDAGVHMAAYLGGRFACVIHSGASIVVVPDAHATQSVYFGGEHSVVFGSHADLVSGELGTTRDPTVEGEGSTVAPARAFGWSPAGAIDIPPGTRTGWIGVEPMLRDQLLRLVRNGADVRLQREPLGLPCDDHRSAESRHVVHDDYRSLVAKVLVAMRSFGQLSAELPPWLVGDQLAEDVALRLPEATFLSYAPDMDLGSAVEVSAWSLKHELRHHLFGAGAFLGATPLPRGSVEQRLLSPRSRRKGEALRAASSANVHLDFHDVGIPWSAGEAHVGDATDGSADASWHQASAVLEGTARQLGLGGNVEELSGAERVSLLNAWQSYAVSRYAERLDVARRVIFPLNVRRLSELAANAET